MTVHHSDRITTGSSDSTKTHSEYCQCDKCKIAKLRAENAELRAEVERLGERLGKMKYPETVGTG